jgi:dipeptidyl aminopeptidase/acylaminoacyl peptidase
MRHRTLCWKLALLFSLLLLPVITYAQGTRADYERATKVRRDFQKLATNIPENPNWIGNTSRFWFRKSVKGGNEFILMDAATQTKNPAFDHARLAASLSAAAKEKYTAVTLPFPTFNFVNDERAIEFVAASSRWQCDLTSYECKKLGPPPQGFGQRGRGAGPGNGPDPYLGFSEEFTGGFNNLTLEPEPPQAQQGQQGQRGGPGGQGQNQNFRTSPDEKWEAFIQNFNVYIRPKGQTQATALSNDGSEGNYYTLSSISWSPDSKKLAAYRVRPGYRREVHFVETSPTDQLQPKHTTMVYAKPGDALDLPEPVLFHIDTKKQFFIDSALFSNPYTELGRETQIQRLVWWKDSRAFTFEYNQRGHQVYRVIEVDAATGKARAIVSEEPKTFFTYSSKKYRFDLQDGKEMIWMSERDGWNHLYLIDSATGQFKNQITKGNWVVRGVDRVDEQARQIWFRGSGMYPGKDPYFIHYYRINFDGTGLVTFTEADGNHSVVFSGDRQYYVDTWSRVDQPTVSELRRTSDQKKIVEIERGDITELTQTGWRAPEVFTSLARDGKTDIWGIIIRPTNFDASKKYPIIEYIYAGPHGSFVPKSFSAQQSLQAIAELGFIVVQIDGMGTNNRSKAFHDVAWQNIRDAGFPDRILWHKAVAAKYPYYDITRVGIYGTSAGGQNSTSAVLFHPEFYKVAVSNSGCHDNRMDKIWWNEQWMGWPLGPHYSASSNVDNAYRLQGKLLLVVPEMDTNVDPASTYQVVNALIKANKKFDQLTVPGDNHGTRGVPEYYMRLLQDFFVHHLQGIEPPDWNKDKAPAVVSSQGQGQDR